MGEGATGVLLQLGGIVRVAGDSPTGDGWLTVVAHPRGHFATAVLRLHAGAVATVASAGADGLLGVSVVADGAWQAELLASTALEAGPTGAREVVRAAGVPGLLIDSQDRAVAVGAWSRLSAAGPAELLVSSA